MRFSKKVTTIVAGVGTAALGVALVGLGSGVGAQFTDSATATASVSVGNFGCQIIGKDDVTVSNSGHTATFELGNILTSAPDKIRHSVTVKNSGDMPIIVNWTADRSGSIIANPVAPIVPHQDKKITSGQSRTYELGVQWDELNNAALGTSGKFEYTATCLEVQNKEKTPVFISTAKGGTSSWAANGDLNFSIPEHSGSVWPSANDYFYPSSSTLPTRQPTLTATTERSQMPKWVIDLDNGLALGGFAGFSSTQGSWQVSQGSMSVKNANGGTYWTWGQIRQAYGSANVDSVQLVAFGGDAFTASVTCAIYGDHHYVGDSTGNYCPGWYSS